MEKNKSIDGLKTKDAKKPAGSTPKIKKSSTTVKSTKSPKSTPKSTKSTRSSTSTKSTKAPKSTKSPVVSSQSAKTSKTPKTPKASKSRPSIQPKSTPQPMGPTITIFAPNAPQPTPRPAPRPTLQPTPQSTTSEQSTPQPTASEQPTTTELSTPTPQASAEDFLKPTQSFNFDEQTGELQAADEPIKLSRKDRKAMKKSNKKPISKKRKIITGIILAIVILLIAGVIWFIIWGNDIIAKITGGQGNIFDLITFVEPTYEPLRTDDNGRTNILAFGTSGYNMEGDEGNGTHDGAQLTDSIMVISLNQETGDMAMLSLPRDLKASPTCTATGKINEVYWCNNRDGNSEQEGAEALMTEVSDILGVDFQYYAHLNWGSLVQIVDMLDGITVTLDEGIYDYYYTEAVYEPGIEYTLNGEQALGLARARHGTTSGDFSRGASQQKIIIGIKDKIFEKHLSLTDIIGLANTLGDNLRTNFNVEELKTIAHLASEFDFEAMRQVSLIDPEPLMTTGSINGISYVLPSGGVGYYTRIQDYVAKMFSNDPREYEDPSILVLNGTETPGLASAEQNTLQKDGYVDVDVDDAPEGEYTNKYTLYSLTDEKPGTKRLLEEKYTAASPAEELPAGISTDYDFILILGGESNNEQNNN